MNPSHPKSLGSPNPLPETPANGWLKLSDYGNYSHEYGLQRVSKSAAMQIARHFYSIRGKLSRKFGGLPIYIGHPDDDNFKHQPGHQDTRAYGWIQAIEARIDGLWVLPKWSSEGKKLLQNAFYKFLSPRWVMQHLYENTYEPIRLVSVGLTNTPNIPGDAIANSLPTHNLNIESVTQNLIFNNQYKLPLQSQFLTQVQTHMQTTGASYLSSWLELKKSHPELFHNL